MLQKDSTEIRKNISRYSKVLLQQAVGLIYPRVCPVCGKLTGHNAADLSAGFSDNSRKNHNISNSEDCWKNPFICNKCRELPAIPKGSRCVKCSRLLKENEEDLCEGCRNNNLQFDRGISLLVHDDTSKKILYDLKYSNKRDNADMLAAEAAVRLGEVIRFLNPEVLIPIPLHKEKEFKRGFNQAEILAKKLSGFLSQLDIHISVDPGCLKRTVNTQALKTMGPKDRIRSMKGAFELSSSARMERAYQRVMLVDDIYTTGATLSEAAKVLKENGTEQVFFLTFSIG